MSMISSVDRRGFLKVLMGLGLAGMSQCFLLGRVLAKGDTADRLGEKLPRVYDCLDSAKVIGREYLRIVPEEAQKKVLLDLICRGSMSNQARLLRSDVTATRRQLQDWIRKDFEMGHTVMVNGWMLSQTESRICALTAVLT